METLRPVAFVLHCAVLPLYSADKTNYVVLSLKFCFLWEAKVHVVFSNISIKNKFKNKKKHPSAELQKAPTSHESFIDTALNVRL